MPYELAIPELVRARASSLGDKGLAWLTDLDAIVAALARDWELALGPVMSGGSAALVAEAVTEAGLPVVLKVPVPDPAPVRHEAAALQFAGGRGYARLLQHDPTSGAMLLERLGTPLHESGLPLDAQLRIICTTLETAWRRPPIEHQFMNGREKAEDLAAFITELWQEFDRPCSERVVDRAVMYARRCASAFAPETCVLAHGDAHALNTMRVPGSQAAEFKFIDPDGLVIEPAYDLAISMRGWNEPLLAGDAVVLGLQRARFLSELTGVSPGPIWEWGFIERVSTAFVFKQLAHDTEAAQYLAVSELWAAENVDSF
ncbi:MAG: aminoglycoside phosphotransferase family protein [Tepidiformaceae bacterium]